MSSEGAGSVIRGQPLRAEGMDFPVVPAIYSAQLASVAERFGVAPARLLEGTGVDVELLEQPDARLTTAQAEQIARNALRLTKEPGLAFHYGLQLKLSSHGRVGLLAMTSSTLSEVIAVVERYSRLRAPDVHFSHSLTAEHVVLELSSASADPAVRTFLTEALITAFVQMLRALLGRPFTARFRLRHGEPAYFHRFRHLWPGPVDFEQDQDGALLPRAYLDEHLQMADSVAARHARRECEAELARLGEASSASAYVRQVLRSQGTGIVPLADMARRRAVSERTLKRHLQAEGTTYRKLVEEARQLRAVELLSRSQLGIAAIAHELGYADPANFHRAFRRWFGTTPDALRATGAAGTRDGGEEGA